MTSFDASPIPNQITIRGANATLGTTWEPTRIGINDNSNGRE